ncbi:MAG: Txe/YoeB family addiction module toxin [Bacillota bacterium]|nr:Txe/YoeB family addiction module toxin [Bacillota bacterium]MDW7678568.1 Txe/YoeB family addiction module toxin [Bacillota bacterium]
MNKMFSGYAWDDYTEWRKENRKVVRKINELLKDIERNGHEGIGKPEPLRQELSGYWSRRITDQDRLIYRFDDETIYIIGCKGHYD